MADPKFFKVQGPFTLAQLAETSGARLGEGSDPEFICRDVAPLEVAGETQISFLDNPKYKTALQSCKAGAVIVRPSMLELVPQGMAVLVSDDPYRTYAKVATRFYPRWQGEGEGESAIHPSAFVAPSATLGEGVRVLAGAIIGENVQIGQNCVVGANSVIEAGVTMGDHCHIAANVTLQHAILGNHVILHPGVCIGQDGFGFAMSARGHLAVPQLGRVVIGDDVEIGANTTIDRGSGPDTQIGPGCRIDNLVQIGHNVQLGRGVVVVSQVGISGSTKVGDFVVLGGQVGIAGHLNIGMGAQIAAQSGVIGDIPPGSKYGGFPARPLREMWRQLAALKRLSSRKESKGAN